MADDAPGACGARPYVVLIDALTAAIREETGLSPALALQFAELIAQGLSRNYAGDPIYVPTHATNERQARYAAIRTEFDDGVTVHTISKKYGLSRATVYQILAGNRSRRKRAP